MTTISIKIEEPNNFIINKIKQLRYLIYILLVEKFKEWKAYADNVIVIIKQSSEIKRIFTLIVKEGKKMELKIKIEKSKIWITKKIGIELKKLQKVKYLKKNYYTIYLM